MGYEGQDPWRVREYASTDIPDFVRIANMEYGDEPTTVEQEQHWEATYPKDNPRLRLAVEGAGGGFIGFGDCSKPFWAVAPGVYMLFILTHPARRREGIGQDLLRRLTHYAQSQGAERLWTDCRESQGHTIRFLERAGFTRFGIRFESAIDVQAFEPDHFAPALQRADEAGYRITTLADLLPQRPDALRELYEVHHAGMKDVPLPGGIQIDVSYEQWRKSLDGPNVDPAFIFLALWDDAIVGMTSIELLRDGPAITDSTTVLRDHRGRGVAMALKVTSLAALKRAGRNEARTHNDTENPSIIHLNAKLGYERLPGWLQWEKRLL